MVFHMMPPSFTCVIKTKRQAGQKEAARYMDLINERAASEVAQQLFADLPLSGFNHLLFRCDNEEKEISDGKRGTYGLEKNGPFTYAGIASFINLLRKLKVKSDMGHELFNNMRDGDWLLDYFMDRLSFMSAEFHQIIVYLSEAYSHIKTLPKSFRPYNGSRLIEQIYNAAIYELT